MNDKMIMCHQYARYLFYEKHRHRMTKNIVQPKALKFAFASQRQNTSGKAIEEVGFLGQSYSQ